MKYLSIKNTLVCLFIFTFFACKNKEKENPDNAQLTYILSTPKPDKPEPNKEISIFAGWKNSLIDTANR